MNVFGKSFFRSLTVPLCALALVAHAQYETDTLPPGVTPRGGVPADPEPQQITPAPLSSPESSAAPESMPTPPPQPAPELINAPTTTADEKARFLTGRRLPPASRLGSLQNSPWYLDHARAFSRSWRRFDELYFSKMRAWSAEQLAPRVGSVDTVFYLFGGPDFINAFALFPSARTYILGGLEPVGSMVPPERLDESRLAFGLEGLRDSTSVILQFSHFITRDMKVDFDKTDFKGVLPILLAFVSLGGGEVLDVRFVGVTKNGELRVVEQSGQVPGLAPGVMISFRQHAEAPPQTLYYIQSDLSDGAVRANPGVLTWMRTFAPGISYLKAASYLMHEPYFSTVRSFLLNESRAILQDDSGIPLRYFAPGSWHLAFFGNYTGTLDIFQKYFQQDLDEAYRSGAPVFPIEFGTGYKWQVGESNLMLAIKGGPPETAPQSVPPPRPPTMP